MRKFMSIVETRQFKAPEPVTFKGKKVFLAGSIDMGEAEDWQLTVTEALSDLDVAIMNPRRDDWDSSWEQDIDDPQFNEQVTWELDHQDDATLIVMYFDKAGKAPITLLELGLYAASGKVICCCPEGFWRRGNVQIVCDRYDIPLVDTLDELIELARKKLS